MGLEALTVAQIIPCKAALGDRDAGLQDRVPDLVGRADAVTGRAVVADRAISRNVITRLSLRAEALSGFVLQAVSAVVRFLTAGEHGHTAAGAPAPSLSTRAEAVSCLAVVSGRRGASLG